MKPLTELLGSRPGPILVVLAAMASILGGCFCPCFPVSCDAWPFADAWVDENCDGLRGDDEEPLPGVCVWSPRSPADPPFDPEYCTWDHGRTNEEGHWQGDLVAGCFSPYFIVAQTPVGFEPTTDTAVDGSMESEFGFAHEGTCPQVSVVTPEEMAAELTAEQQRNRCLAWGLFLGLGLALFVLAYRWPRSESQHSPPALGE